MARRDDEKLNDPTTGHFTKGHSKRGGRAPGTPNKLTVETKRLLSELVYHGLTTAKKDYDRVRKKLPATALRALARFVEYEQPKLARVEQSGPDGGPLIIERRVVEVRLVKDKPDKE